MNQMLADPDAVAPGGRLGAEHATFGFEADFAADLRCIPMVVRFKLDRVGVKLSLKQWTKIGPANRRALAARQCDTHREVMDYRRTLVRMVAQNTAEPIVDLRPDPEPAWTDPMRLPELVIAQAAKAGVAPPTGSQWAALSTLQRFALLKLARSNHDNDNFAPAMREFGLL